jgi:succinate dehydrogenase / fumarate reductase iron-sulfur subunit
MKITFQIWRQKNSDAKGRLTEYQMNDVSEDSSFLETLDQLNESLVEKGEEPVEFEHDCREGICGSCAMMINGVPHGPEKGTTACQLHMRSFKDGEKVIVEPWRAKPFPVRKDLTVDRSAFDRIINAGGFISVNTGAPQDANSLPIEKEVADSAFDAATCIGCGACVAACKNASAMLFVSAKATHLNSLPQGQPEKERRALNMVNQMDAEGFGNCTNTYDCEGACPKEISVENIAHLNRDFLKAAALERK